MRRITLAIFIAVASIAVVAQAQAPDTTHPAERPRLYVVGTSHLDTQWRWSIRETINEFVPATFEDNYKLMKLYPGYVFTFEGAFRYMLLREYRPDLYNQLKPLIDAGQWRVGGSWVDAVDVNLPSLESLVRHALYGNGFYKREFGITSRDVFLPDCFGFGYALPAIANHCGIRSFSTQKLTWGSSVGVPFDIGVWEGVDGSSLVAGLNPGAYVGTIESDLTRDTSWLRAAQEQQKKSGLPAAYRYFGTGDTGGAPDSASVAWLAKSLNSDGPLEVISIGSDDLIEVAAQTRRADLPRFKGELLMTRHGVGCYTSQAAMKRWNRRNELLADATEKACVAANLLAGAEYPRDDLRDLWIRFLWHQFHDDLTGTSIPEAYEFSWNDEILCQNRFAAILENAISHVSTALDTRAKGTPLIVCNPVAMPREDIVEATIRFDGIVPEFVSVFDPKGKEVPSQVTDRRAGELTVVFLASTPSAGFAVYDVRPAKSASTMTTDLVATANSLENSRYRVQIDAHGDVSSILDKQANRELLARPIQMQLLHNKPDRWPAWEIDYDEIMAPLQAAVGAPATIEIVERGPARVALKITRKTDRSSFSSVVSLAAGDAGNRVEFHDAIDWYEKETLLKAAFPLAVGNEHVTYDLGLGATKRGINHAKLYEVPGHQWADMTAPNGDYGVAILNDCRYGWDHPDSTTLRLSLVHTPGVYDSWSWVGDQSSQDMGHHQLGYAVMGHSGSWEDGGVVAHAAAFNQPLLAFQTIAHPGKAGREFSLVSLETQDPGGRWSSPASDPGVFINSVKFAEDSDELIVRLKETKGRAVPTVRVHFAQPTKSAREVNGAEEPMGSALVESGALETSLGSYRPRAYAVTLERQPGVTSKTVSSSPVALDYNLDGISLDGNRRDGDFESGRTLAGDLIPDSLRWLGVDYVFGPKSDGANNVLECKAQSMALPVGQFNMLSILATAVGGPALGTFQVGARDTSIWIQDYADKIGQWNNRLVAGNLVEEPDLIAPAYINRAPVAWYGSHRHSADGENEAYQFTYLYLVNLPIPEGTQQVTLPDDPRIRVLAATWANLDGDPIRPSQNLYDAAEATLTRIAAARKAFVDSLAIELSTPIPGAEIRYTLDGSDPTTTSPMYAGSIVINTTSTIKSRAFLAGADDSYIASATYHHLTMRESREPTGAVSGLACDYYEGSWDLIPGFDTIPVVKSLTLETITVPEIARDEDYGVVLKGFINVPADGLYDFYLSSDDGSHLYIADTLVVDNDGLHGMGEVVGGVGLRAGAHPLLIRMFQKKGDEGLTLFVDGPGVAKQEVPAGWLSHLPEKKGKGRR
ncbi:MAG: glycoside hydrolase family 38 C-terminal domain-containing protein [Candidatus Zixiibacteriota bacterium]